MAIDGTYGFVYCGAEDIGIGVSTALAARSGAETSLGAAMLELPPKRQTVQLIFKGRLHRSFRIRKLSKANTRLFLATANLSKPQCRR
jgi:hypothetical protein